MIDLAIAVAAHKPYRMPDDPCYIPVQVGAALHPGSDLGPGFRRDDEGDSISERNPTYCELTALWWIWRNVDAEYKGLVHYRRYFRTLDPERAFARDRFDRIATGDDIRELLMDGVDALLPRRRDYVIETVYSHYSHTFDAGHFDATREAMLRRCPEYVPAWDTLMISRRAYLYNMSVMRSDLLEEYCLWLFPLLSDIERAVDSSGLDAFQARWPGRVAERLFNAWIATKGIRAVELPVVSPERVNWFAKGRGFLGAKFLGKRYTRSF